MQRVVALLNLLAYERVYHWLKLMHADRTPSVVKSPGVPKTSISMRPGGLRIPNTAPWLGAKVSVRVVSPPSAMKDPVTARLLPVSRLKPK